MSFLSKEKKYPYPSRYGSHRSMVIKEEENKVICKDEYGEYETTVDRLDTGLSDSRRQR